MIRYYCDRCGVELASTYTKNCLGVKLPKLNNKQFEHLKNENLISPASIVDVDLCPLCVISLADWCRSKDPVIQ